MKVATENYPVAFQCESKIASSVLCATPVFRGHVPLLTLLYRLLPISKRASMRIGEQEFRLDLGYSTHVSCIKLAAYEPLETAAIGAVVKEGDNFLDVGANWGYFSAIASHYVGSAGTVFSVEANPATFIRLSSMLRLSGASNVLPFNFAVGDRDDEVVPFVSHLIASDAFGHVGTGGILSKSAPVIAASLDRLWTRIGKPRFRMAKIDVEGVEPAVIDGARECLSTGISDCVLVEINSWTEERCGQPYQACFTKMVACGFDHVYEPVEGRYHRVSSAASTWPVNNTFLFSRRELPEGLLSGQASRSR